MIPKTAARNRHTAPTTMYDIPKKPLAPPNQDTVERTRCFLPLNERTSKPEGEAREGWKQGGKEGGVRISLLMVVY